ncbi:MAG TPA: LLM class flavin-dependent oxidoreductase [Chloroflexota bacterium]|jgi:5,10-methylenetetrahydromethanopterin reductase
MKFTFGNLPSIGWQEPTGRLVELAQRAEAAGFERFGVSDWRYYQDCFVVMTACLQRTTRLQVESLVTDPYVRHPSLTAAALATMDELAPGRAIMGIGGGVEQPAFWGESRPKPVQAVREAVEICRRMWRGERVEFEGEVMRLHEAHLQFVAPRPDIDVLIAARGKRMLALAGEIADIVHLASFFVNVEHHRENLAAVFSGAERGGRGRGDFEIDISMPCSISDDREAARAAARRPAAQGILWTAAAERYSKDRTDWVRPAQFRVPDEIVEALSSRWDFWTQSQFPRELADLITDDILDEFALAGTAEECAARLQQIQAALPEITGLRIYAVPPAGASLYEGYVNMIDQFEKVIRLVNAPVTSGAA